MNKEIYKHASKIGEKAYFTRKSKMPKMPLIRWKTQCQWYNIDPNFNTKFVWKSMFLRLGPYGLPYGHQRQYAWLWLDTIFFSHPWHNSIVIHKSKSRKKTQLWFCYLSSSLLQVSTWIEQCNFYILRSKTLKMASLSNSLTVVIHIISHTISKVAIHINISRKTFASKMPFKCQN